MLTFAIGDVHGCASQLKALVDECVRLAKGRPAKFILIGDYIDRGPDSKEAVQFIMDMQTIRPGEIICLCGNHEDLLNRIERDYDVASWLANGGDETLASYGVSSPAQIPERHLEWLQKLSTCHDDGQRFYVHAGVRPGRSLDQQKRRDLLWIREPFLSSTTDHGRLIIHGHTPTRGGLPDIKPNRINIDTGAVFGGPLTAAVFSQTEIQPIEVVQVSANKN